MVKTDSKGNEQWNKTFGGSGDDMASSVQQTSEGGYILAGFRSYTAFKREFWLVKTDSNGNEQWDKAFRGKGLDIATSVQQTSDSGYILAGYTGTYGGNFDIWVVRTDSNGNKLWDKTFGGSGNDEAYSIQQTSDRGYIIAGSTDSYGIGKKDYWLIKLQRDLLELKTTISPKINTTEQMELPSLPPEINFTNKTINKEVLEEFIEVFKPQNEVDWYSKGSALSLLGRCEEAITAYDMAIKIKPDFSWAWNNKGLVLRDLGRYEEALEAYDKAIATYPSFENAWNNKCSALIYLESYDDALKSCDKAIEINSKSADAWNNKGLALIGLKRYEEALNATEKAVEIYPKFAKAWYDKGSALYELGRKKEAEEAFKRAHEFDPTLEIPKMHGFESALGLSAMLIVVYFLRRRN